MPRHRAAFLAATTSLGLSFLGPALTAQQPPGGGPSGSGAVGRSLLTLVNNRAVQAELKVTPEQKSHLESLSDKADQQRQRWFAQMGLAAPGGDRNRVAPGGPAQPPSFEAMVESRREMQQSVERAVARILSKAQVARIRQIQLQLEGPAALLQPELQERLNLNEDQVAMLRELLQERRQTQRATRDAANARRQAALDRDPTLRRLREQMAQDARQAANGADDPGGQNGGAARRKSPANDPAYRAALAEARRKLDRDPENRKQTEALRADEERIERQFQSVLHTKILTGRQSQAYKKMLGAPFDPAAGRGDRATAATPAKPPSNQTASRPAAKPKPQSLRERRGLATPDDRP